MRTSSDGGHKNISNFWVFSSLCTDTNETLNTQTLYTVFITLYNAFVEEHAYPHHP